MQEQGLKKVAIVGGNAKAMVLSGGGSASLKPSYFVSPYEGIVKALHAVDPDIQITYSEGARGEHERVHSISGFDAFSVLAYKSTPTLDLDIQTEDGKRGWTGYWYAHETDDSMTPVADPMKTQYIDETKILIW